MKIDEIIKQNDEIELIIHGTIETLIENQWQCPIEELKEGQLGGTDEDGNEHEYSFNDMFSAMQKMNCYGFCDLINKQIHIWYSKDVLYEDLIYLIAHERAHFIFNNDNDLEDEINCERLALCAVYAIDQMNLLYNNLYKKYNKKERNK